MNRIWFWNFPTPLKIFAPTKKPWKTFAFRGFIWTNIFRVGDLGFFYLDRPVLSPRKPFAPLTICWKRHPIIYKIQSNKILLSAPLSTRQYRSVCDKHHEAFLHCWIRKQSFFISFFPLLPYLSIFFSISRMSLACRVSTVSNNVNFWNKIKRDYSCLFLIGHNQMYFPQPCMASEGIEDDECL